jgi:hypothetical protein
MQRLESVTTPHREVPCTVKTARLFYHLNMEMTLLHSNPFGIVTDHYYKDSVAAASFPCLGGKRALRKVRGLYIFLTYLYQPCFRF